MTGILDDNSITMMYNFASLFIRLKTFDGIIANGLVVIRVQYENLAMGAALCDIPPIFIPLRNSKSHPREKAQEHEKSVPPSK
jgi:hypothetical protein